MDFSVIFQTSLHTRALTLPFIFIFYFFDIFSPFLFIFLKFPKFLENKQSREREREREFSKSAGHVEERERE